MTDLKSPDIVSLSDRINALSPNRRFTALASQKQIEANRNNALKSTGPKSATGLQVVAKNAVKHGVFSTQALFLPGEDEEAYQTLRDQFYADFQATSRVEKLLVEKMAQATWKKQRLAIFEQRLLTVQQEEHAFNSMLKQKALQEESSIQVLESEIKALQDEGESLQDCLKTCEKFNRMRPGPKRGDEGEGLARYVSETLNDAQKRLCTFLDSMTLLDAREDRPKYPESRYARALIVHSMTFRSDDEESDCDAYPIFTHSLERVIEVVREREAILKTRLEIRQQRQALAASLTSVGLDLLPNENNLDRIQRYEAYLDNQFYKALHELQKLQAFFIQKKKAVDV